MNSLYVGLTKTVELPKRGYLFIDDEIPDVPRARVFDVKKHSFNPLEKITPKEAREIAEVLYTIAPQGENTLTVRNGRRALLKAMLGANRLDRIFGEEEIWKRKRENTPEDEARAMIEDLLTSPVLRNVLCNDTNFSFNRNSRILARINRAELGDFDALVLGLFLMFHFKGQLVIPDFGFYGRDVHTNFLRQNRLIAGVHFLDELSPALQRNILLIKDKVASRATFQDAATLAQYDCKFPPHTDGYDTFIKAAMD